MKGVVLTPLRRIPTPKGDVLHGMKAGDEGYAGFGEAYLSSVQKGAIKGWKRHREMTLNLICVVGAVRIVVHDGSADGASKLDVILSPDSMERYCRLTVPPNHWFGFQGVGPSNNMLLNIANMRHDPAEADAADLDAFPWPQS
jgi:dTDP-4-dehydrorhamnose 3,5-epimerase